MNTPDLPSPFSKSETEVLRGGGERVTHLHPNTCYYAHLSIYHFSAQFCLNRLVLDAGSGTGYGAAYLADHGARYVHGIDIDEQSIQFSIDHFPRANLTFGVMDLTRITGYPDQHFDVIVASNTLEHVSDASSFMRSAHRLLKPKGILIVAVPPITRDIDWAENINNPFHLNIWTPRQWQFVIRQYFADIQPYWFEFAQETASSDFYDSPGETDLNETDFVFEPIPINLYYEKPSLGAIFTARTLRPRSEIPPAGQPLVFIEGSFTRGLSQRGVGHLRAVLLGVAFLLRYRLRRLAGLLRQGDFRGAARKIHLYWRRYH